MRRAKPLRTALPCAALISQLIRIDQDPFVVNFAIAFVDVGLPQEVPDRKWGCADAVIQALQHLAADPFCSQMQALFAYTISLLDYIPDAFLRAGAPLAVSVLLEDWLLDIALAQPGMRMVFL